MMWSEILLCFALVNIETLHYILSLILRNLDINISGHKYRALKDLPIDSGNSFLIATQMTGFLFVNNSQENKLRA